MIKKQLINFNDVGPDLLFWIKQFLVSKIAVQKIDDGYTEKNPKKNDKSNELYFNREQWQQKLMDAQTVDEVQDITYEIRRNGLKKLATFSVPSIHLFNYIIGLKKVKSIKDIDTNLLYNYVGLEYGKYSENTQKNYYTHIKSIFKFIDRYSISEDGFMFNIGLTVVGKKAKAPVNLNPVKSIKYLEPDVFVALIKSIENFRGKHPNPKLPNLMLKFYCFLGLRANELRNIDFNKDVSFKVIDGAKYLQLFINGKNDQGRYMYLNHKLIQKDYEAYLAARETDSGYLFYNRNGKQYAVNTIYDLVKRAFQKATNTGIDAGHMDTHGLRRSYATYLLSNGVDYNTISTLLGHTDEESIQYYAFASKRSFADAKESLENL